MAIGRIVCISGITRKCKAPCWIFLIGSVFWTPFTLLLASRTRTITYGNRQPSVQLIAFYFPQYHTVPENDQFWGQNFTDWVNVKRAKPQFQGHYQPHVPMGSFYYDLRDQEVMKRQVELSKLYGISGFCFHIYWFHGRRILETPVNNFIANQAFDQQFCFCWANERWTRRWDGQSGDVLVEQSYSPDDDLSFIANFSQHFADRRYIRFDGRPVLIVYRVDVLPNATATAQRWRNYCRENGIGEIYLVSTNAFGVGDPRPYGFDSSLQFPPHNQVGQNLNGNLSFHNTQFSGRVAPYEDFVDYFTQDSTVPSTYPLIKSVFPGWDNSPRRPNNSLIIHGSTPAKYRNWLKISLTSTAQSRVKDSMNPPFVFINAWNEWGEGAHIEPDERYGLGYLEATRDALSESALLLI